MLNLNSDYKNMKAWVTSVKSQQSRPPISELIRELQAYAPHWENFVYATWGDNAANDLLDLCPDEEWLAACTPYFVDCMDELADDLNEETTLWRYHILLRKLGQHFINAQSTNPLVAQWQKLCRAETEPKSLTEHWARLLLGSIDNNVVASRLAELLEVTGASFPTDPVYMSQLTQKINGSSLFSEGSALYNKYAPQIAAASFWKWMNGSTATLKEEWVKDLLQAAEVNPLLRWYCLGMINPRTHTSQMAESNYRQAVGLLCDAFIIKHAHWFQDQADLVLNAVIEARDKVLATYGINRFAWVETWLLTVHNPDSNYSTDMLLMHVDKHDILWWLKPEWKKQLPITEAMGCDFSEIINLCRSIEAPVASISNTQLPDSLSL